MPFFYKIPASEVEIVEKEAVRYAGIRTSALGENDSLLQMVREACKKLHGILMPALVYEEFNLTVEECQTTEQNENEKSRFRILFADVSIESHDLGMNLKGCKKIILLAGTVGAQVDMHIRRAQQAGSAEAAIMQAAGAMFIESFIDKFNEELKSECKAQGFAAHSRFSPGYGDVPLEFQKEIFRLLPCSKIGLTLMDSLIMAPEKSVTAFIGLE